MCGYANVPSYFVQGSTFSVFTYTSTYAIFIFNVKLNSCKLQTNLVVIFYCRKIYKFHAAIKKKIKYTNSITEL